MKKAKDMILEDALHTAIESEKRAIVLKRIITVESILIFVLLMLKIRRG